MNTITIKSTGINIAARIASTGRTTITATTQWQGGRSCRYFCPNSNLAQLSDDEVREVMRRVCSYGYEWYEDLHGNAWTRTYRSAAIF